MMAKLIKQYLNVTGFYHSNIVILMAVNEKLEMSKDCITLTKYCSIKIFRLALQYMAEGSNIAISSWSPIYNFYFSI